VGVMATHAGHVVAQRNKGTTSRERMVMLLGKYAAHPLNSSRLLR
jgi:hypothetical protein